MDEENLPLHHFPGTTGDQALYTTPDCWADFFSACWDAWEEVVRRRAAKQVIQPKSESDAPA